jgi:hypothetical protein
MNRPFPRLAAEATKPCTPADAVESTGTPWYRPIAGMPLWQLGLRCLWVIVQVFLAYCLSAQVSPFFYQQF